MNFRNLEYLIQEAFIGIWRNGIMAVASLSTVAFSMAILGVFLLLVLGSHHFAERQLAGFELKVFMPRGGSEDDAIKVRDAIEKLPLAKNVVLLSRDKEYAKLKRNMSGSMEFGGLIPNPLPYALDVKSKDSRKTGILANQIRRIQGVANVADAQEDYKLVKTIADIVKLVGFIAAVVLVIITVFLISNAIRLTLFARRHEIKIMQLVGATNWFIRVPLVLEGIVLGAVGALVAIGLISIGSECISSLARELSETTPRSLSSGVAPAHFVVWLVVGGAVIGALGSLLSIRRFLRI